MDWAHTALLRLASFDSAWCSRTLFRLALCFHVASHVALEFLSCRTHCSARPTWPSHTNCPAWFSPKLFCMAFARTASLCLVFSHIAFHVCFEPLVVLAYTFARGTSPCGPRLPISLAVGGKAGAMRVHPRTGPFVWGWAALLVMRPLMPWEDSEGPGCEVGSVLSALSTGPIAMSLCVPAPSGGCCVRALRGASPTPFAKPAQRLRTINTFACCHAFCAALVSPEHVVARVLSCAFCGAMVWGGATPFASWADRLICRTCPVRCRVSRWLQTL